MLIKILTLISILTLASLNAQTDWKRWSAKEPSYALEENISNEGEGSTGNFLLSTSKKIYQFFISDLDGDNCPFHPTCSSFFVDALQKTNIIQGMLMFADRFTRDVNIVKSRSEYPYLYKDHLWDPVEKYTLKIKVNSYSPHFRNKE